MPDFTQLELFGVYNPSRDYVLDITYTDVALFSVFEEYTGTEEEWIDQMLNYYDVFCEHTIASFDEYLDLFKSFTIFNGEAIKILTKAESRALQCPWE